MSVPPEQMDTAQTARSAQAEDPQDDIFGKMVAALRNHIFGNGEQGIMGELSKAEPSDVGRKIGEMVFAMVSEVAHQAEEKGAEIEYDTLIGVATEAIDDMVEMAEAAGLQIDETQREYALLYAQQLYVENQNPTDDQRNAARQDLALMKKDGMVDEATRYVQMRGQENGSDPFDVAGMGGESEGPQRPAGGMMGGGNGEA